MDANPDVPDVAANPDVAAANADVPDVAANPDVAAANADVPAILEFDKSLGGILANRALVADLNRTMEKELREMLADVHYAIFVLRNLFRFFKRRKEKKSPTAINVAAVLRQFRIEKANIVEKIRILVSNEDEPVKEFRRSLKLLLRRGVTYIGGSTDSTVPAYLAVQSHILSLWRERFTRDIRVDYSPIYSKDSCEIDKNTSKGSVLMMKDKKTDSWYIARPLLSECYAKIMGRKNTASHEFRQLDVELMSDEEVVAAIAKYGITAPYTKNPLSDPCTFSCELLMSLCPSRDLPEWYRRPAGAKFCMKYYNLDGIPFTICHIGEASLEKISARSKCVELNQFRIAEILHFFDSEHKSHKLVADLELVMIPRGQTAINTQLGAAVSRGIVSNEILAYYIGKTYQFLNSLNIDKNDLRMRQRLANELAFNTANCWVAEIKSSYGWFECADISELPANDLEKLVEREKMNITLIPNEDSAEESDEPMVVKNIGGNLRKSVIQSSFGIGRIMYAVLEYSFNRRPRTDNALFCFPLSIAPCGCSVFCWRKKECEDVAAEIRRELEAAHVLEVQKIPDLKFTRVKGFKSNFIANDACGIPFAITVRQNLDINIRERDSMKQVRVLKNMVAPILKNLINGKTTWSNICMQFPQANYRVDQ